MDLKVILSMEYYALLSTPNDIRNQEHYNLLGIMGDNVVAGY